MNDVLEMLASTPDIRTLQGTQRRLISAMRMGVVATKRGRNSCCVMKQELGSAHAVAAFRTLVAEIGDAWPEPFSINPPCQPRLSYDEMLLLDITTAAARGERAHFDGMTCDMLSMGARNSVYRCAQRLMTVMMGA
ncbi:hypothetical protein KCG44_01825 [Pacificimonas sp. WHA3]|uniref:Uncharacterized protein n=1 Tax=Pacificimonas pallii TaxID=2827236 RepID=A0ABS6SAS8_9SPHN|nr:hypothetical protein [Pacificimonas pallii]MBV7255518.1 hypothetical protein [Pacificimonas pallii]